MKDRFRKLLRAGVPNWSVEGLRKLVERADSFARLSYSQDGEDMILRRLFEGRKTGFYVDVGAHHPFRFSNTCYFHRAGWRGVNIDPDPSAIDQFRRARPRDINLCVGIAEAKGMLTLHMFSEPALNTFDPALAAARSGLREYRLLERRDVSVCRLDEVLGEHLPEKQSIDFLSIDVEGLDLQVLKSNDWNRFRPRVLLVEARALDMDGLGSDASHLFVGACGYRLIAKTVNTLIYQDGSISASSKRMA